MAYADVLHAVLDGVAGTPARPGAAGFIERNRAMDLLELHLAELENAPMDGPAQALCRRAAELRHDLQQLNDAMVQQFRQDIVMGRRTPQDLAAALEAFVTGGGQDEAAGNLEYDDLDVLVADLLGTSRLIDDEDVRWEAEMVSYQPTPARVVLDLVRWTRPSEHDVFVDIGSGLGAVPLLVSLLSNALALGIEFQPSLVAHAQQCARGLQRPNVRFVCQDARVADLSSGTIFYMYTPFRGAMLQDVVARLHAEALRRSIRICTYGPSLTDAMQVPGLDAWERVPQPGTHVAIFQSRPVR